MYEYAYAIEREKKITNKISFFHLKREFKLPKIPDCIKLLSNDRLHVLTD